MPKNGNGSEMNLENLVNSLNQDMLLLRQELSNIRENFGIVWNDGHVSPDGPPDISVASSSLPLNRTMSTTSGHRRGLPTPAEKEWQRKINAAKVEI